MPRGREERPDVSAGERAVSALVGYSLGGVVVLPFDRLKTLMQVAATQGKGVGSVALCRQIVAEQGVRGLYQGAGPHMMIAPFTMFYFSVYGELLQRGGGDPLAPLGAAVCARTLETTLRMPLELVRTQMQAAEKRLTMWQCLRAQWSQPSPSAVWLRGWLPTLLRDVPFSAIYWVSYERTKQHLVIPAEWVSGEGTRTFAQGFFSGAIAGMIAALATTPTDVVKTLRQHRMDAGAAESYREIMAYLVRSPRYAFAGVGPRLIRIPLGLATMMSGLEATKWAFEQRRLSAPAASLATSFPATGEASAAGSDVVASVRCSST